uniref:Uncharacterized protein n=1 Tax=Plectus sambesii TaxID=2011161 RepID=A0A914W785_9BILA
MSLSTGRSHVEPADAPIKQRGTLAREGGPSRPVGHHNARRRPSDVHALPIASYRGQSGRGHWPSSPSDPLPRICQYRVGSTNRTQSGCARPASTAGVHPPFLIAQATDDDPSTSTLVSTSSTGADGDGEKALAHPFQTAVSGRSSHADSMVRPMIAAPARHVSRQYPGGRAIGRRCYAAKQRRRTKASYSPATSQRGHHPVALNLMKFDPREQRPI